MPPMQIACPQCRAPLQLMVQALPSRAACPHCRTVFTISPSPVAARPALAPMPSARAPAAGLPAHDLGRDLRHQADRRLGAPWRHG
jgi:hypothetical protein